MPSAPTTFRPIWLTRRSDVPKFEAQYPERRGSARQRGYDTNWQKARKHWFMVHPLCVCCKANGVVHPAKVLDHIEPHKGDRVKFWNTSNWQGLCEWCDKNIKRSLENDWLKHKVPIELLKLTRPIDGWIHPADR